MIRPFQSRLCPASPVPAYREEDHWVWGASPLRGEDGRYHLFASRWSKQVSFLQWATHSEVVRAVSDVPQGPYTYAETVLPARGTEYFDGRVTHNPVIRKHGDHYLLFYTGTTFQGEREKVPASGNLYTDQWVEAWNGKRIGLAVSKSLCGPWTRASFPLLAPQAGAWDAAITSNPAPWVHPDGSVTLIYKSTDIAHPKGVFPGRFHLGCAQATHWSAPFERSLQTPVSMNGDRDHHLEDGCLWWNGEGYELIAKDMTGEICGEAQAAIHAYSKDACAWQLADPLKAYSRTVQWQDGGSSTLPKLERPQLLFENEVPVMLFAATLQLNEAGDISDSYNLAIPLHS